MTEGNNAPRRNHSTSFHTARPLREGGVMGMFDSVNAECPACNSNIEYQTKANEDPQLDHFTVQDAPTHILTDVLNSPEKCRNCGSWVVLYDPKFHPIPPRPVPSALIVRPPKGKTLKHTQGMEWWPDNEAFEFPTPTEGSDKP